MRRWLGARWLLWAYPPGPASRLCIRCRDQGFILPADDASPDTCRGHMAEDRVNELIKGWGL